MNPNVKLIRSEGIRIIRGRIPSEIRKALNEAVRNNELGHLKKDGLKPEIYCHPNSIREAMDTQKRIAFENIISIKNVIVRPSEL
jgi:hypothetical protein